MASHNLGKITASTVSSFLTGAKSDNLIKGNYTACAEIASELLALEGICEVDPAFDSFDGNKYTEYGNMYESDAITRYEEINFVTVHGKQEGIGCDLYGCTPDGLVGEDGMIEVKCVTKLKDWIALDIYDKAKEHKDQIQFAMWRTGRKWCDFIAYQPRFKQPYDIKILRVFPDAEWIKFAEVRLPLCWSEIKRIKSNFLNA